jgi:hypothetical protein
MDDEKEYLEEDASEEEEIEFEEKDRDGKTPPEKEGDIVTFLPDQEKSRSAKEDFSAEEYDMASMETHVLEPGSTFEDKTPEEKVRHKTEELETIGAKGDEGLDTLNMERDHPLRKELLAKKEDVVDMDFSAGDERPDIISTSGDETEGRAEELERMDFTARESTLGASAHRDETPEGGSAPSTSGGEEEVELAFKEESPHAKPPEEEVELTFKAKETADASPEDEHKLKKVSFAEMYQDDEQAKEPDSFESEAPVDVEIEHDQPAPAWSEPQEIPAADEFGQAEDMVVVLPQDEVESTGLTTGISGIRPIPPPPPPPPGYVAPFEKPKARTHIVLPEDEKHAPRKRSLVGSAVKFIVLLVLLAVVAGVVLWKVYPKDFKEYANKVMAKAGLEPYFKEEAARRIQPQPGQTGGGTDAIEPTQTGEGTGKIEPVGKTGAGGTEEPVPDPPVPSTVVFKAGDENFEVSADLKVILERYRENFKRTVHHATE